MTDPDVDEVLGRRVEDLVAAVWSAEARVHDGDSEGIHDLRVAMRRLRSLLASVRPLLDPAAGEHLRQELRWAGQGLGALRDLEVVHERLAALLAEERVELVLGAVQRRIEDDARERLRPAADAVAELLAGERFAVLRDELRTLAGQQTAGGLRAEDVKRLLWRDWRRVRRRARSVPGVDTDERAREAALHEVRKAAKRARYAAETWEPLFGYDARVMAEAAKQVQQTLGDHRDTLLTRPVLRRLGVQAHLDGDNGFTFGRLHAREQAIGAAALVGYDEAIARVDRKKLRRWLR